MVAACRRMPIGNQFAVQELYGAGQNLAGRTQLPAGFREHTLAIEVGWSPVGDQFAGPLGRFCNFQNGIICGHNNAMTTITVEPINFPTAEWGARV